MNWISLGSLAATIVFGAGLWVASVRVNREEIKHLKQEIKEIKAHNILQDQNIAEFRSDSKIIMVNLEYIKTGLDELRKEHKERQCPQKI